MKWFIGILILGLIYYIFILKKQGNLDFWKLAHKHQDEAYKFFKNDENWVILEEDQIKPEGNNWDGPFRHRVPMLGDKLITVYGKNPEYISSQKIFIDSISAK